MIANGYWLRKVAKRSDLSGIDLLVVLNCADRLEAYDSRERKLREVFRSKPPTILIPNDDDQT